MRFVAINQGIFEMIFITRSVLSSGYQTKRSQYREPKFHLKLKDDKCDIDLQEIERNDLFFLDSSVKRRRPPETQSRDIRN